MVKRIVVTIMLSAFIAGTFAACIVPRKVPPGQIKKELSPGHRKKHH
jgi:hypothetical protein